jgi:hypothetical protein
MRQRCNNPNSRRFYTHGGRGIKVCKEWEEFYENFVSDMGHKPNGYTIDRIDNDKGYSKDNCRWATPKEQAQNRRTNVNLTYKDKTLNLQQWSELVGITCATFSKRVKNWGIERAVETPLFENFRRTKNGS